MNYFVKKFKEVSHQKIEDIKRMQKKHARDILQPRDNEGQINPDFIRQWGIGNLNLSRDDIQYLERKAKDCMPIIEKLK